MQYTNGLVKIFAICSMCIAPVALLGCASKVTVASLDPSTEQLTGDFSRSKLIASDFAAIMGQLPESPPSNTVLYIDKPATRFGGLLLSALQSAGFELRIGDSQSPLWLVYSAARDKNPSVAGNPVFTFLISAGSIKLKRSYEVDQFGVRPVGRMLVQGATSNNVVVDDSIFSVGNQGASS